MRVLQLEETCQLRCSQHGDVEEQLDSQLWSASWRVRRLGIAEEGLADWHMANFPVEQYFQSLCECQNPLSLRSAAEEGSFFQAYQVWDLGGGLVT